MTISDESAFTSKPFTFIVEGSSFSIHAGLVSDCSAPLDRMINGHLFKAKQAFANLEDVNKETFVRFVRWIYSKDYPAVEHTIVTGVAGEASAPVGPAKSTPAADDDWGIWGTKKDKKKKKKDVTGKGSLKEAFVAWDCGVDVWGSQPKVPRSNKSSDEDYTEVFLCHARLYVFAEQYDIQPLKQLALLKLHQVLAIYTLYPDRKSDVISLLKYVYANTSETKQGVEDIRTMLALYIASEMEFLVKEGEIKELLVTNEEMLSDFLDMFAQRIA